MVVMNFINGRPNNMPGFEKWKLDNSAGIKKPDFAYSKKIWQASEYLRSAREGAGTGDVTRLIKTVKDLANECANRSGTSLHDVMKDIGTTEEELRGLQAEGRKSAAVIKPDYSYNKKIWKASEYLRSAVKGAETGDVTGLINNIKTIAKECASKAGSSLTYDDVLREVGATDGQLKEIQEKGCEKQAFILLDLAIKGSPTKDVTDTIDEFIHFAVESGKPLEYFNTTIDKLTKLYPDSTKDESMSKMVSLFINLLY